MNKVYCITVKNSVATLNLSPLSVCRPIEGGLVGFDAPETGARFASDGFGDGGYALDTGIPPRELSLTFEVTDKAYFESVRASAIRLMNPHEEATLTVTLTSRHRSISAYPCGVPEFSTGGTGCPLKIKMSFTAPSPFFSDGEWIRLSLPTNVPLLSFPFSPMAGAGTVCAMAQSSTYTAKITNPGDVSCGFIASLRAVHGSVDSPYVSMNGHFVKFDDVMLRGDSLTVDTRRGSKGLICNGTRRYSFTRDSTFFSLGPGENTLTFSAEDNLQNLEVSVRFVPLYLGA